MIDEKRIAEAKITSLKNALNNLLKEYSMLGKQNEALWKVVRAAQVVKHDMTGIWGISRLIDALAPFTEEEK